MTTAADAQGPDAVPIQFVTRGLSAAEVAAVTAVLTGVLHEQAEHLRKRPEPARSRWADRESLVRRPLRPGPGAWRHSGS